MLQLQGFLGRILVILLGLVSPQNHSKSFYKYTKCCIFFPELSLDHANLEEKGIRFPEASSSNISDNANEMSTFLELPKQNKNSSKGKSFILSKLQWLFSILVG